jgi:hypothetical protein
VARREERVSREGMQRMLEPEAQAVSGDFILGFGGVRQAVTQFVYAVQSCCQEKG